MVIVSLRNFFYNTYIYISDDFLVFISGWNNKQAVVSISQINKKKGLRLADNPFFRQIHDLSGRRLSSQTRLTFILVIAPSICGSYLTASILSRALFAGILVSSGTVIL